MSQLRKPYFVLAAVLVLILLTLAVWLRRRFSPSVIAPSASIQTQATPAVPSTSPVAEPKLLAKQLPGGLPEPSDPRWKDREMMRQIDPNGEWKMPISFYGRVVDQSNDPISEAKVEFSWTDLSPAGSSASATLSDGTGAFSLNGKTGRVLQVDVSKDGYYKHKDERLRSFDYAAFWEENYHQADPNRPIVFHLRKKGGSETLIVGDIRPTVSPDGAPMRLDLLKGGRISADGQVEVAAVTNTEKYPPRAFDWRASIAIENGGLIEHNLEFPFEAPEDGYAPQVEFEMSRNAPDWRRSIEKTYFIRFGSPPKYGRIHIRLNGASQKVSLSYAVNPTGSRNLEAYTDEQFSNP